MPELPFEIWKARITNEFETLRHLNIVKENSIVWHTDNVELWLNLNAVGFTRKFKDGKMELTPKLEHKIFVKINRSFPYPGGIDFSWYSNIFHPNIHPVMLTNDGAQGTGYICLNILRQWSKLSDIETSFRSLKLLVENANPNDPLEYSICLDAAEYYKKNSIEKLFKIHQLEKSEINHDDNEDHDKIHVIK